MGIMATIISVAALYFTYYQIEMSREHYRLSVKPHITFHSYPGNLLNRPMGVFIVNTGIGPAMIKNYKIIWKDQIVEGKGNVLNFFLEQLGSATNHIVWAIIDPGIGIGVNDEIWLVKIDEKNKTNENTEILTKFLKSFNVEIKYESMYKNEIFTEKFKNIS